MKQHITQKQWNKELTLKKQLFFIENISSFKSNCRLMEKSIENILEFFTIGYMIEFLGNNWHKGCIFEDEKSGLNKSVPNDVLCDVLWEAVKDKLNKKTNL